MGIFKTYVGIDYSGAKTPVSRNKGLQVFKATLDCNPIRVKSPAGKKRNWTRKEIAHWCIDLLNRDDPDRKLFGVDESGKCPF